ncbi:hypothetical protein OTB20_41955 [Streptomyces sp. H27-H1]|uniref:hypothetical protein n=1 Tax=Streptomyces sp. H27-H1 TaxID=2996461 RepID=UPI0022710FC5|nr:hypothetical protein [Streptomyces sp. H27-H1]MCY0932567.1 hypothetical protein [Streptomyces sp. H27-H1]
MDAMFDAGTERELVEAAAAGVPYVVLAAARDDAVSLVVVQADDRLVTLSTSYVASGFDRWEAQEEIGKFGFLVTEWKQLENGRHVARAVHERRRDW